MMGFIKRSLIGRPLKSSELMDQKLSKTKALAILSSDALSSVAYGPEQILIVLMAVIFVILLTILNLRGVTESATILAYPVYLFVLSLFILMGVGIYRIANGEVPMAAHTAVGTPVAGVTLFLLLKAFASGSSALTGVEAISNAIPNFRKPAPVNATRTLLAMGGLLAILFAGIVFLAYYYGIVPNAHQTVVSQIAEESFGRGIMYFIIQGMTALILVLAANTGFSAFPLLAVNLSKDKYIPRMFQIRGDRLGYSNGIILLGLAAIVLIILFGGKTESLIPLYATGVFIPFTLAQSGMMKKWWKERPKGWQGKFAINMIGAIISFTVAAIFFMTRFTHVWPILIFIPVIVIIFHRIKLHYDSIGPQLKLDAENPMPAIDGNVMIIPVSGITKMVENSINYVQKLHPEVMIAVYIAFDKDEMKAFEEKWNKWQPDIRLVTLYSPYRSIIQPLTKFIDKVEKRARENNYQVSVTIPQFIPKKGWHNILHNQSSMLIKAYLLYRRNVVLITIPFKLLK